MGTGNSIFVSRSRVITARLHVLALGALLAASASPRMAAQEKKAEPAERWQAAQKAMQEERWAQARKLALGLVEDCGDQPFLHEHADEVVELVTECEFRCKYKQPPIQELLAGEVDQFDERSGRLRISYSKKSGQPDGQRTEVKKASEYSFAPGDFSATGTTRRYAVRFEDEYFIEIAGVMPSPGAMGVQPEITVCMAEGTHVRFTFTWPTTRGPGEVVGTWSLGSVYVAKDGVEEKVQQDTTPGLKFKLMYGNAYRLRVDVDKDTVVASLNGIKYHVVKKPGKVFGQLEFSACPNITSVTIDGTVDREWINEKYEPYRAKARTEFLTAYDPAKVLPSWLIEAAH